MESFRKLGIAEPILRVIEAQHFERPSEIQEKSIPLVLAGRDVIAQSATGSGKTLAFGACIIQNCVKGRGIQALVLTPTRELAEQLAGELKKFSVHLPLRIVTVYGGVAINPQVHALPTADVVVGTPGRILDHLQRNTLNLSAVRILVLDEADRMLDMGFIDDVEKIISQCPRERQTMLFSATMPSDIIHLAQRHMNKPENVAVESYVDPSKLRQIYYDVQDSLKFSLLVHLLRNEQSGLIMVFCNTKHNTDFVANNLKTTGIDAVAIHGGFSQNQRTSVMKAFHSKDVHVLVCTDVAARGLDIPGVSHVYNYDIPLDSQQYIHRVGRTARAGHEGKAVNIVTSRDHDNFRSVLRDHSISIGKEEVPYVERVSIQWKAAPRGRSFGPRTGGRFERSGDNYSRSGPSRFGDRQGSRRGSRPESRYGSRSSGRPSGQGRRGTSRRRY